MERKIKDFVEKLKSRKINLWVEGNNIHYKAPNAAMTPEIVKEIKEYKQQIVEYLTNQSEGRITYINEKDRYKPFPLTDVQAAYMLGRKKVFQYGGVSCHIYIELSYKELIAKKVEEVWKQLIQRHDMLRAVIDENGYQTVEEEVGDFKVECVDLMGKVDEDCDTILRNIRYRMGNQIFELGKSPMFEILVSQSEKESIMHFSMEFLIADWTSIWILLKEFEYLYFNMGKHLPEIGVTFRDYLLKERELKDTSEYYNDKAYWLKKINALGVAPILPMKYRSISQEKTEFERYNLTMVPELWNSFAESAKKNNVTPTAAVLCVYAEVLRRWSENKDFVINLTVLNRKPLHENIGAVVGDFTSISLLNVKDETELKFSKRTESINRELFENLDHTLFSGIEVMREITRERGQEAAFMPYVFTSAIGLTKAQNQTLIGKFDGYGISQTPQVFIDCQVTDGEFGLKINWDVRKDVFPDGMIADMFEIFKGKLLELSKSTDKWNEKIDIQLPDWQTKERLLMNKTEKVLPIHCMYDLFLENVQKFPDKMAVVDCEGGFSYIQLKRLASSIAKVIVSNGGKRGDKIAVLMGKSRYQVAAVLGILLAGGVYVPIDGNQANYRMKAIIEKSGIKQAIVLSNQSKEDIDIKYIYADRVEEKNISFNIESPDPSEAAYIIYTSGTTGEPKGVVISHESAMNTIEDIIARLNLEEKDSVLGLSQLTFDLSVFDIFGTLTFGGTLVYPETEKYLDPEYIDELVRKYKITVWNSVPAFMEVYLNHIEKRENYKSSLKYVMLSGDWIPLNMPGKLCEKIDKLKFYSLGGATEASIWSNIFEFSTLSKEWTSIPYGHPLTNQKLFVLDSKMNDCPVWVAGDFYIAGKGLALEYLDDVEKTKEKFLIWQGQRIYKTGDRCRYLPGGELEFLGRNDRQVKIRGHRIELGEVECALEKACDISKASVFLDTHGELTAVVEPAKVKNYNKAIINEQFYQKTCEMESIVDKMVENLSKEMIKNTIEARDNAALVSMLFALQSIGLLLEGHKYKMSEILASDQIHQKYKWLIRHWVIRLAASDYVRTDNKGLYMANENISKDKWNIAWQEAYSTWTEEFGTVDFINYVRINAENMVGLIKGECDPVSLLYPEGSLKYTQALYVNNVIVKYINRCISDFIENILAVNKERNIKILEIGAGTGATTTPILNQIEEKGYNFEYYFTDVLKYFLPSAKAKFGRYNNISFYSLDMDRDYREQGFAPNSFDIIIGAYVLENAKDIEKSIVRVKELLKSGGYFIFSEPVHDEAWILASQGFMMMEPEDRLRDKTTFISVEEWSDVLNNVYDKSDIKIIPSKKHKLNYMGINLFIKQFKSEYCQISIGRIKEELKQYLPNYMIPKNIQIVDNLPLTSNGKIDINAMKKWEIAVLDDSTYLVSEDEQNKDNIESQISKIWKGILRIEQIGKKQNFYDFGADSLIMAQVATRVRSEIIKSVPFDLMLHQLLNEPTIEQTAKFIRDFKDKTVKTISKEEHIGKLKVYGGNKTGTARVLIHGAFGTLKGLDDLAESLLNQSDELLIGIEIFNFDKYMKLDSEKVISELADDYIQLLIGKEIKKVHIIGYSYGGIIGVELATRLLENDVEVLSLSIIDSVVLPYKIKDIQMQELIFLDNFGVDLLDLGYDDLDTYNKVFEEKALRGEEIEEGYLSNLSGNIKNEQIAKFFRNLQQENNENHWKKYANICSRKLNKEMDYVVLQQMFSAFVKAFESMTYIPELYLGNMNYFYASNSTGMYKHKKELMQMWSTICLGEFKVTEIAGDHYSCIEKENVQILTEHLLN